MSDSAYVASRSLAFEPLAPGQAPAWHPLLSEAVSFCEALQRELAAARRSNAGTGVLVLGFNAFRGTDAEPYPGLQAGLSALALERLQHVLRGSDVFVHLTADLFAIVPRAPCPALGCALLARRLLHAFGSPLRWGERQYVVRPGIGIALAPRDGAHARELLPEAWIALQQAWELGQPRFRFRAEDLNHHYAPRLAAYAQRMQGESVAGPLHTIALRGVAPEQEGTLALWHAQAAVGATWNGPALVAPDQWADQLVRSRWQEAWRQRQANEPCVDLLLPRGFLQRPGAASALLALVPIGAGQPRLRLWAAAPDWQQEGIGTQQLALLRAAGCQCGGVATAVQGLPLSAVRARLDALLLTDRPGPDLDAALDYLAAVTPGLVVASWSTRLHQPPLALLRLTAAAYCDLAAIDDV